MGELLFLWVSHWRVLGNRLVRTQPPDPASTTTQSETLSPAGRRGVVYASQTVGSGVSGASVRIGTCASLRREFSGEPDVGNLHLRFDEGRVGRGFPSPSLLLYRLCKPSQTCVTIPSRARKQAVLGLFSALLRLTCGRYPAHH